VLAFASSTGMLDTFAVGLEDRFYQLNALFFATTHYY
jgi:hypothetical protein